MIAYHGTAAPFDAFDAGFRGENTGYHGAEMATFLAVEVREANFYAEMSAERLRDAGEEIDERILMVEVSDDLNLLIIDGEGEHAALRHARNHGFDGVRWPGGNASNCGDTLAIFSNANLTIVGRYARRAA